MQPDGVDTYVDLFVIGQRLNGCGDRLFIEIQPATLMKNIGKKLTPAERDHIRAELVRTALTQKKIPTSRRLEN